jgi:MFS family permease
MHRGSYASVLADPQARAFTLAGLLARLPLSMTGLGIVLLVSLTTGSFGAAGLVTALATLSAALVLPWWGRRVDLVGQARVLITAALIAAAGLTAVTVTVLAGLPLWTTCVAAMITGLGATSSGACVRARWTYRLKDPAMLNTAYSLEAVFDEVVFIVGPVLVTFLATTIHPAFALGVVVLLGLAGALALGLQRGSEPPPAPRDTTTASTARLPIGLLVPLMIACAALGGLFGGMEVVVVAFTREHGILPHAGTILMVWATGSLIAGVVYGTIGWKASAQRRFRVAAALLAGSMVPLLFLDHPVAIAGVLLLSGLAVAPTLIASVALIQQSVPASRLTEALGWTSMGMAAGVALGAAGLGQVIDHAGSRGGFAGMVAIALVLVVAVLTVRASPTVVTAGSDTPVVARPPIGAETLPP